MVYSVSGQGTAKIAIINGMTGQYGQINPTDKTDMAAINYGRNAVSNFSDYNAKEMGTVESRTEPAYKYQMKFLPEDKVDFKNLNKMALLGASYEDLGGKEFQRVDELNKPYEQLKLRDKASVEAYDINVDGNIDVGENAVSILVKDMTKNQHPNSNELNSANISGEFTNSGDINSSFMLSKGNAEKNRTMARQIYEAFKLGEAQNKFLSLIKNPNKNLFSKLIDDAKKSASDKV